MAMSVDRTAPTEAAGSYARLEEKILERDQRASSQIFYDLVRAGRPLPELLGEIVRIVNNDHCLLSSRASMDLMKMIRPELAYLPLAQTIWYLPTGLDPWNQLLGKMPGHYVRLYELKFEGKPPLPEVHWAQQEPLAIDGTFPEKLNTWLTLVQRGEVVNAYRVFLGLWEEARQDDAL